MAVKIVLNLYSECHLDLLLGIGCFVTRIREEDRVVDEEKKLKRISLVYKTIARVAAF